MRSLIGVLLFASVFYFGCTPTPPQSQRSENANTTTPAETPKTSETRNPTPTPLPDRELAREIAEIAKGVDGKIGVYAVLIESNQAVALNESQHFPMQSVVKLPIAMTVLSMVDQGKLRLDQIVNVASDDMTSTNQRSPIRDANPNGIQMTIEELLKAAISESDGTAADVLQRVAGGAESVQRYVESLGVNDIQIKYSHKEFGSEWLRQYDNWATPNATVDLLRILWDSSINAGSEPGISQRNAKLLLQFMTESHNPNNRLLGMLPKETVVAHKTGTGGTQDGVTSAINDVGMITLPDGKHVAIAVYIKDSTHKGEKASEVIAKIAKAIFDKWSLAKTDDPVKSASPN